MSAILLASQVSKSFGGIKALDNVSVELQKGELLGLIGPNGAGKSTLFEIICGSLKLDSGAIYFQSKDITRLSPFKRSRLGIKRTFQKLELFQGLNVMEHLLIASRANKPKPPLISDLLGLTKIKPFEIARAIEIAELVGLGKKELYSAVGSLSLGHARLVELARALAGEPKVLLLDEPSSGLDQNETEKIVEVLFKIQKEQGISTILVEHDLGLIKRVSQRIYVLDAGKVIAVGAPDEVFSDPLVRKAYMGELSGV
jgi:branched-chain amino acid transport system ATP-binding protein